MVTQVDFKITVWGRIESDEPIPDNILEKIKSEEIATSNELFEALEEEGITGNWEILTATEEQMEIEENGYCSTIEILDEGNTIWSNGQEDKI